MEALKQLTSIQVKQLLLNIAELYIEKEDELSKYDAVIGDGDHGITMSRGARAAKVKVSELEEGSCRDYMRIYGRTLVSILGGAIGPLFGSIFLELSKVCKNKDVMKLDEFYEGFKNAELKIMELGGAKVGDKTMIDAISPTVFSLGESLEQRRSLSDAFKIATTVASQGVKATIPMRSKRGRSKFLEDKSIGHQDAGATSFYYMIKTISDFVG